MVGIEAGNTGAQVVNTVSDPTIETSIEAKEIGGIRWLTNIRSTGLGVGLRVTLGLSFKGTLDEELGSQRKRAALADPPIRQGVLDIYAVPVPLIHQQRPTVAYALLILLRAEAHGA